MINVGILPKIIAKSAELSIQLDGLPRTLHSSQAPDIRGVFFLFAILCFVLHFLSSNSMI
jgi:hypothetical protein